MSGAAEGLWAASGAGGLGRAVEALIGVLEADVVCQLITVWVELTHLPLGLQGIRGRSWGSEKPPRVASAPGKVLPPPPAAHGVGKSPPGRSAWPGLCPCSGLEATLHHQLAGTPQSWPCTPPSYPRPWFR